LVSIVCFCNNNRLSLLKLLRIFISLIELLGISGFKANPDRVLTVEALTRLKTLIRIGFLCKDVSIEEIISSTGTLLVLKQNFGPFSNTDFSCHVQVLDEKLITPGPRVDEVRLYFQIILKTF